MTLPDVYCLFNRARGTELVSPDDMLQAAKMFTQVGGEVCGGKGGKGCMPSWLGLGVWVHPSL